MNVNVDSLNPCTRAFYDACLAHPFNEEEIGPHFAYLDKVIAERCTAGDSDEEIARAMFRAFILTATEEAGPPPPESLMIPLMVEHVANLRLFRAWD